LKDFVEHLAEISHESYRLLLNDFETIFTAIDDKIGEVENDDGVQEMVELLVSLQEENDRGVDVMNSDDEDEEYVE
jgi:hypothetical protein